MSAKVEQHVSRPDRSLCAARLAIGERGNAQAESRILCVAQIVHGEPRAAPRRIREPGERLEERVRLMIDGQVVHAWHFAIRLQIVRVEEGQPRLARMGDVIRERMRSDRVVLNRTRGLNF